MTLPEISAHAPSPRLLLILKHGVHYPRCGKVLTSPAAEVTEFDAKLRQLIVDMFFTMYKADGVGLAATQIGLGIRVAVVDTSFGEDPAARIVLVNPRIVDMSGSQVDLEGCLSLPGFKERVERAAVCRVEAQDENGNWREFTGEGLLARALQHECDHLDGKLFIDRVSGLRRSLVMSKVNKLRKQGKW